MNETLKYSPTASICWWSRLHQDEIVFVYIGNLGQLSGTQLYRLEEQQVQWRSRLRIPQIINDLTLKNEIVGI